MPCKAMAHSTKYGEGSMKTGVSWDSPGFREPKGASWMYLALPEGPK